MKKVILLMVLILSFAGFALAETKGKKVCLEDAGGNKTQNEILCDGAKSDFPLDCFLDSGGDVIDRSILCSGAVDYSPIDCYIETVRPVRGMSVIQGAILCSGVTKSN